MELRKVTVKKRTLSGKGPARRLRVEGMIPAVAYGRDLAPQSLAVSPKELVEVIGSEYGRNTVLELDLDGGGKLTCLLCDFQYHPVTRQLLHADFFKIDLDKPVDVDIPLELTGRAKGVVEGGVLRQVYRKLPVRCLPKDIPVNVTHDITELEIGRTVTVRDVALPEGVAPRLPLDRALVAIVTEKKLPEEEVAAAPAVGAVPGAEGAAAPAAAPAPAPEAESEE
jgi:large subunit ribosomal protein L25